MIAVVLVVGIIKFWNSAWLWIFGFLPFVCQRLCEIISGWCSFVLAIRLIWFLATYFQSHVLVEIWVVIVVVMVTNWTLRLSVWISRMEEPKNTDKFNGKRQIRNQKAREKYASLSKTLRQQLRSAKLEEAALSKIMWMVLPMWIVLAWINCFIRLWWRCSIPPTYKRSHWASNQNLKLNLRLQCLNYDFELTSIHAFAIVSRILWCACRL